jgi:hypothetical protein
MIGEPTPAREPEILDLTQEPRVPPSPATFALLPFEERRFREYARIGLAGALVLCILVEIIFVFSAFLWGRLMPLRPVTPNVVGRDGGTC